MIQPTKKLKLLEVSRGYCLPIELKIVAETMIKKTITKMKQKIYIMYIKQNQQYLQYNYLKKKVYI